MNSSESVMSWRWWGRGSQELLRVSLPAEAWLLELSAVLAPDGIGHLQAGQAGTCRSPAPARSTDTC